MKKINFIVSVLAIATLTSSSLFALEVDREVAPRITLGGRVISTVDYRNHDSDADQRDEFNLADSTLLLRFDKRMFSKGVAGATIGIKEEGEGDEKKLLMQELQAFYWNQDYSVTLGRTRLNNTLIEFPLLRDDDFIEYTHVGNASSNNDDFDQLYAEQVSIDWFVDKKLQHVNLWSGTRANEAGLANLPEGFDSWGAAYSYRQTEDLLYVSRLRHAGIMLDLQKVNTASGDEWMNAIIVGAEFNLNMNPTSNWSMAIQSIFNQGVDGVVATDIVNGSVTQVASRAASPSNSLVAGIRYTARPHLLTRWQTALTLGYKEYSDVADASQWTVSPNFIYRIGQGVDVLSQFNYTNYSDTLGGGHDSTFQVGISFSLEQVFNDTIGERDSILNLEHGYIN